MSFSFIVSSLTYPCVCHRLHLHLCCACLCETELYSRELHDFPVRQSRGVKTSFIFPFCLLFHFTAMLWCWFLCASLSSSLATFWTRTFLTACVHIGPLSSSVCVLIGPGLPLPTDAAPPTTAQCIRPAAHNGCPRTSLSLFPHSSSLVRRDREGSRYRTRM